MDLSVMWRPTRPDFSIVFLRGTSTSRGYHESYYEVISRNPLDDDDFTALDKCNLLGMGQAYSVVKSDTFAEPAPPVSYDRDTGEVVDVPPVSAWDGTPITNTVDYTFHRYTVRRICDSGD